jgi:hypothetical protein
MRTFSFVNTHNTRLQPVYEQTLKSKEAIANRRMHRFNAPIVTVVNFHYAQ